MAGKSTRTIEERFWSKVRRTKTCWLWTGAINQAGYGNFYIKGKYVSAHRARWFLKHRHFSAEQILHKCDTPNCIRISHLFEGTQLDNIRDMDAKGRRMTQSRQGEQHHKAKLTNDDVRRIRRLREQRLPFKQIVAQYPVCLGTIEYIVYGKGWTHID